MASSTQSVISNGSLVLLDLSIEYLERADIHLYFDGVEDALGWSWVGLTEKRIAFSPAVPNGVSVLVKRITDITHLRHEFSAGAAFTASTLDEDLTQVLHIAQEAADIAGVGISVGTVTTGAAGSAADVDVVGSPGNQVLSFVIPRGDTGTAGAPNVLSIGTVTSGAAAVSIAGSTPNQVLNFVLQQGPQGVQGIPGPAGAGSGNVNGPASAEDNQLAQFSGTTGTLLKVLTLSAAVTKFTSGVPSAAVAGTDYAGVAGTINGVAFNGTTGITVADATKQPLDAKLTALAGFSGSGLLRITTGTYSVDTSSYSVVGHTHTIADISGLSGTLAGVAYLNAPQTWNKAQRGDVFGTVYAATYTLDLSVSNNFSTTLTGNVTLANPTNVVAGQSGVIQLTQDATGSRIISWGANWKAAGGVKPILSTAANSVDILSYYVLSSTSIVVSAIKAIS